MGRTSRIAIALVLALAGSIGIVKYCSQKNERQFYTQEPSVNSFHTQESSVSATPLPSSALELKVTRVIDGDTYDAENVRKAGNKENVERTERIRCYMINAPERGMPFYKEAKNFLEQMLLDKDVEAVYLIPDVKERDSTQRKRLLGYTFIKTSNGKRIFVDEKIVERGLAKFQIYPPYENEKYKQILEKAQEDAKREIKGIWGLNPKSSP